VLIDFGGCCNLGIMIEMDSVCISYGGLVVQDGFCLSVGAGEKVALCGGSGCGKSSVLGSILGFVIPHAGRVVVDGVEVCGESVWGIRRLIGYVAQEPDLGEGTLQEIIERAFSYRANCGLKKNLDRVGEMLGKFALAEPFLSKDISTLSGGEKQRFSLIIALLLERKILLLDEISSALDPKSKQIVADYLSQSGQTIILVSHDPVLQGVCGRVVTLKDSKTEMVR